VGIDENIIFENESNFLAQYVEIQKYYRYGTVLNLVLFPKAVIKRERAKKKLILEKEMQIMTKQSIISLRQFEKLVLGQNNELTKEIETEYFDLAKTVKKQIKSNFFFFF
jgi:hypothetical protein